MSSSVDICCGYITLFMPELILFTQVYNGCSIWGMVGSLSSITGAQPVGLSVPSPLIKKFGTQFSL